MTLVPENSCVVGIWTGMFCGEEGFDISGMLMLGKGADCSFESGNDATISTSESENLTNIGLDTR